MVRAFARWFLRTYRRLRRWREHIFALLCRRSFLHFGKRSTLGLPLTIWCENHISIGDKVYVGPGSWLEVIWNVNRENDKAVIEIRDDVSITGSCFISAETHVLIEEGVLMGRFVHISDHSHQYGKSDRYIKDQGLTESLPIRIKQGAWLGQGVVVCPGVTVGRNAVIGANSVVKSDIPDFAVAVGAPAKVIRICAVAPVEG